MQSLLPLLPSVACCVAIQGFWLGVLLIIHPQQQPQYLQDLHRLSRTIEPTVQKSGLKPRA
jgi:hypothetical protein